MTNVAISTPSGGVVVGVGSGYPTKVMALIGNNSRSSHARQLSKLDALAAMSQPPDVIADLSITRTTPELIPEIIQRGFPASALPVYAVRSGERIDERELFDRCVTAIALGARMLTIHPTATERLIELAQRRLVPWTSRGGGVIIRDLLARPGATNAYLRILPELADFARRQSVVLSLGATFRSANIFDSLDQAQVEEIDSQLVLANELSSSGVMVIIESPGHAAPASIAEVAKILRAADFPVMPLGPIPTDTAIGQDHIGAAIGASLMGLAGAAHMLAAVTREEHTGGVPATTSTVEAVHAAHVAAHVIDIGCRGSIETDRAVAESRAKHHTCVVERLRSGCTRCADACPLTVERRPDGTPPRKFGRR